MNKKAIAILGAIFLLIVGTLGFLIYSKYSGSKNSAKQNDTSQVSTSTQSSGIDASALGGNQNQVLPTDNGANNANSSAQAYKLIDDQVVSPVLFYNGNGITYFNKQGQLFQASIEDSGGQIVVSSKKQLEIPVKSNITKILWPQKGDNFIAQLNLNGKKAWSFFDSRNSMFIDLPASISSLDFLPNADKIYYIWSYPDPNKHDTVNISNPDGKNYQKIGEMWNKNAQVFVSPDGLNVLYYRENNSDFINEIGLTTPDAKIWRSLVKEGYNYGALWSPDSKKFLFGKKNSTTQQYQLWYYDLYSGEVKNLGIFSTPEKAVWDKDSQTIYVAVPAQASAGSALTTDNFYKFNTSTFEKVEYNFSNQSLDGRDLFLNLNSNKLFFRNAQDGGLYYLDLSK
jgi:type II secretory pathway pseudopilin PulG